VPDYIVFKLHDFSFLNYPKIMEKYLPSMNALCHGGRDLRANVSGKIRQA
jgi:hypothetical protein